MVYQNPFLLDTQGCRCTITTRHDKTHRQTISKQCSQIGNYCHYISRLSIESSINYIRIIYTQGRSQRGDMGECPPSWIEKNSPELQTDDCFATGVMQTPSDVANKLLVKNQRKMCNFNVDFFENFLGATPRPPYWGGATAPLPTAPHSALRRFAPRSGPSVRPSSCPPPYKNAACYAPV